MASEKPPTTTVRVVPATKPDEADALGYIHAKAFSNAFPNVFPMGPAMTEPYLNFRRSQVRSTIFASSDPEQVRVRGRYTTHILQAFRPSDSSASEKPVGIVWYDMVPRNDDLAAKEVLNKAKEGVPPLEFPEGYSKENWDLMKNRMSHAEGQLVGHIERINVSVIAVSEDARGTGVGAAMIRAVQEHAVQLASSPHSKQDTTDSTSLTLNGNEDVSTKAIPIHLDAVEEAVPFYRKLGFQIYPPLYEESWGFRLFPAVWWGPLADDVPS